jgi:hypothetical protein
MDREAILKKLNISGKNPNNLMPDLQKNQERIDIARDAVAIGLKTKGFVINSAVGAIITDINLSGTAKMMLGLRIIDNFTVIGAAMNPAITMKLMINNEVIFENVPVQNYENLRAIINEYFECYRVLNGKDNIQLTINDVAAHIYNVAFYYI